MFAFKPVLTWLISANSLTTELYHTYIQRHTPTYTHVVRRLTHSAAYVRLQVLRWKQLHQCLCKFSQLLAERNQSEGLTPHFNGATCERLKIFPQMSNTKLLRFHCRDARIILPLSREIFGFFGKALQHAPDTSLSDINLINMICPSSVINQAKPNDKWEISLWRKSQKSSPVVDMCFPNISFG